MRIAHFHTNTIFSSWSNLAIPETLRRMGHEVLEGAIPTNANGQVIHTLSKRELNAAIARMPTFEDLQGCDLILVSGPEYVARWLNTLYGKDRWRRLSAPRVGFHLEQSSRDDMDFRYQEFRDWSTVHFYPSIEDVERFKGYYSKGCVDTEMFTPCVFAGGADHTCDQSCYERLLREKKYDAAFLGSLYQKRLNYLNRLLPLLGEDINFSANGVVVRDLSGERHREWAELLAQNLRQIKVHVNLPSNNMRMMVSRPLETMACGTFLLTYPTPDNLLRDGEHCRFYDPENPEELAELIRYYIEHDAERESIARAGYENIRQNYSLKQRLQEVIDIAANHCAGA
jgi:glycosyltransferase involved in cell wall biosynthesis